MNHMYAHNLNGFYNKVTRGNEEIKYEKER